MTQQIALVTGASRGIGAACAVALARAGFDVAIGARTVAEGDGRTYVSSADGENERIIEGSLERTASEVRELERGALVVPMDLLERASLVSAVEQVTKHFGGIDLLVNNAIYKGPGNQDSLLDSSLDLFERSIQANIVSQVVLIREVLPQMLERGTGTFIHMTSAVATMEPPGPIGKGGWGFGYGVSKGGFDRVAGLLNAEFGDRGIRAYNIEPGFVASGTLAEEARAKYPGIDVTPPEAIGASVAWLATSADAPRLLGKTVHGPELCRKHQLLSG